MTKYFLIVISLLSFSVFAQEPAVPQSLNALTFNSYEQIKKSATALRDHRAEIKDFFTEMVARKAQMDITATLKKNHMSDVDIETVSESSQMKNFLERLKKNPKVKTKVEIYVNKLLAPGYIETYVMKQRNQLTKQMEGGVLIARSELRKSGGFRAREEVFTDQDSRSFVKRIWDHLINDLYAN